MTLIKEAMNTPLRCVLKADKERLSFNQQLSIVQGDGSIRQYYHIYRLHLYMFKSKTKSLVFISVQAKFLT